MTAVFRSASLQLDGWRRAGLLGLAAFVALILGTGLAAAADERMWSLEDYRAQEAEHGDIVRPWRRQRNLMYALQDALRAEGLDPGTRATIWKESFRDALATWQQRAGLPADGEISPAVIEGLLGPAR